MLVLKLAIYCIQSLGKLNEDALTVTAAITEGATGH